MKETIEKEITRGGEFVVKETQCESIFTPEDFSEEQKMMFRERKKLAKASKALAARSTGVPKPKALVRRNTWSGF